MEFRERLKSLMEKRGLGPRDVAEKIGVGERIVYRWRDEGRLPRAKHITRLALLFDMSRDEFLKDVTEDVQTPRAREPRRVPALPEPQLELADVLRRLVALRGRSQLDDISKGFVDNAVAHLQRLAARLEDASQTGPSREDASSHTVQTGTDGKPAQRPEG